VATLSPYKEYGALRSSGGQPHRLLMPRRPMCMYLPCLVEKECNQQGDISMGPSRVGREYLSSAYSLRPIEFVAREPGL